MTETSSARSKFDRGVEHIDAVCREARTFENRKAYTFRPDHKRRSAKKIEYRYFVVENETVDPTWALIAGDAIQNLRSSLEYIVWSSVKRPSKRNGFPIFKDECEFQVLSKRMLTGVPPTIRTVIEETQPYKVLPKLPTLETLYRLADLSNLDKHRTLATVATFCDLPLASHHGDIEIDWHDPPMGNVPLQHDAQLTAFTATAPAKLDEMDVYFDFTYQVALEGRGLIDTLETFQRRVGGILSACGM